MASKTTAAVLILCLVSSTWAVYPTNTGIVDSKGTLSEYRLSGETIPELYIVNISLGDDFGKSASFNGSADVHIFVVEETNTVVLHAANLTIEEILIKDYYGNPISFTSTRNETTETLKLSLKKTLHESDRARIAFKYKGILHDDMYGFYRSSYTDEDNKVR